jgi:hypothetical protein
LRKLRALGVKRCIIKSDSQVVIGHVEKTFIAKEPKLVKYLAAVRRMEKHFAGFNVRHISRAENAEADELAKAAAQNLPLPPNVFAQTLTIKAIKEEEERPAAVHAIAGEDWRSPILAFLSESYEPLSKHEAKRMKARTRQYSIIGSDLYRSGIAAPLPKCISRQQGLELLGKIHAESCGAHRGPHEIAQKVMRQGFYWPSAAEDTKQLVRTCKNCQMFARKQSSPANPTTSIIPTWPLQRWGVDIVGPLPPAPGNLSFTVVALEYFSKGIEAKALARITSGTLISFVWQRIICRFGVPTYITMDNGKQVDYTEFTNFCSELNIKFAFALVNHPQSNGVVKRANGLVFTTISKSLFNAMKGKWAQELVTSV